MAITSNLKRRWLELCGRAGLTKNTDSTLERIFAAYQQPNRAYHNLDHVADCLDRFELVRGRAENLDELEFAIWFHDVVYDPQASDNEERSAESAARDLKSVGLASERIAVVSKLILATRHDMPPDDGDESLIVDIDLSILGRDESEFDQYDRAIRQEYSFVPQDEYEKGRAVVLQSFLDREFIFRSNEFRDKYEAQAKVNLERAVKRLTKS